MLTTPNDALKLVLTHSAPLPPVRMALEEALGCCLAEEVVADRDMPPADRAAMDGYAVRSADVAAAPVRLRLVGEVAAGSPSRPEVLPGTCVRILTGANVPPGADTVVQVEVTGEDEATGTVTVRLPVKAGANISRQGEDARSGEVLLPAGTVLGPGQIGVCAAVGKAEVLVHPIPRVVILCTGEEIRDASVARLETHEFRNSNGPSIRAALAGWGFGAPPSRLVPDDPEVLVGELRAALDAADAVLLTGGVSVGRYDFVREAVERVGATVWFHGVAMKPGKPALFATLPGGQVVFGLPGNPLSALTALAEVALAGLRRRAGYPPERCMPRLWVRLAEAVTSKGDRQRLVTARLVWRPEGPLAEPVPSRGSGDVPAGGRTDGTVVVPVKTREVPAGSMVEFHPWRPLP